MSGGQYNYAFGHIENLAYSMATAASTALRKAFVSHLLAVAEAARAIEWNDSGDGDPNEEALIRKCISPTAELEHATATAFEAMEQLQQLLEQTPKLKS